MTSNDKRSSLAPVAEDRSKTTELPQDFLGVDPPALAKTPVVAEPKLIDEKPVKLPAGCFR